MEFLPDNGHAAMAMSAGLIALSQPWLETTIDGATGLLSRRRRRSSMAKTIPDRPT